MNLRHLPALLFLVVTSCTVYREYPIEVYRPAEVHVSDSTKHVTIFYRNFRYSEDTLQHDYKQDHQLFHAKNDPENMDSLLVMACLRELADRLEENNTFGETDLLPYPAFKQHTGEHLPGLSPAVIRQLIHETGSDLLIALETYSSFYSSFSASREIPETKEVITVAVWSIYDPAREARLEIKTMIDTVYWDGYDDAGTLRSGYRPPPRLMALEQAAAMAGKNYADRFYGTWNTVSRMYSVPPLPDFSDAAVLFEEGHTDRAIALWKKYAHEQNGKMAINARYNLALACEMKDDLLTAQKWLDAAYQLAEKYRSRKYLQMITTYRNVLNKRIKRP